MGHTTIKISGMAELTTAMRKKIPLDSLKTVIQHNGDRLNSAMKRETKTAFVKGYSHKATAGSINTVISDGGLTATVLPTMNYDPYVEFGTRFMEAEPFVRPAFNEVKEQFKSDMDKLVK